MPDSATSPPIASPAGAGRIVLGILFILGWVAAHYGLFLLLAGGGVVLDVLLMIVKKILFPGSDPKPTSMDDSALSGWVTPLIVGLSLAGGAGVAAGLAIFWRARRRLLMRCFWMGFLLGVGWELYSLINLVKSSLSA